MTSSDERPAVWPGHISIPASDLAASADFYVSLGTREVHRNEQVAVLELGGGTHLVVVPGEPIDTAPFDLMVDDLEATHAEWADRGRAPSEIERGDIHDSFEVVDPSGTNVTVNSTHVVGPV